MVIISMIVMCISVFGSVSTEHDRRRSGLSNASLDEEYGNNTMEESVGIALNI